MGLREVAVDRAAVAAAGRDADAQAAAWQALLAGALAGGPALLPLPGGPSDAVLRQAAGAPALTQDAALLVATSGSSGAPRLVELPAAALAASATAGESVLGGPASWVLALPLAHVAGWNVLARGVVAGTTPTALPPGGPFTAASFAAAVDRLRERAGGRLRAALVPTQLARLLDDDAGLRALAALDAVLLGGAAAPPSLLAAARGAGARVVTSYGSTETCGGCVYDGLPLPGVVAEVDDDGRVLLGGATLAAGYRGDRAATAATFVGAGEGRRLRTADAGRRVPAPTSSGGPDRLEVLGRLDDVVVTGAEKVSPAAVEAVLGELAPVRESLVVGVPDEEWGQAVVALVVLRARGALSLEEVRAAVGGRLGPRAAPRHLVLLDDLPRRALGKPDRHAAAVLAAQGVGAPPPARPSVGGAGRPAGSG